ncbi:hypothetical protein Y032_0016g2991 [Ancylostoma ceylanicum]|uniref:Uncharacterized protein n=1 Tax=Ancylostoma ceylanicum TaxID=53326 RepID=A0A016V5X3_9BILA|nr:hypothetical protein Y032_0016g2991 [Ancylostoma ceylanicum]
MELFHVESRTIHLLNLRSTLTGFTEVEEQYFCYKPTVVPQHGATVGGRVSDTREISSIFQVEFAFVLRKKFLRLFREEARYCNHPLFLKLHDKLAKNTRNRFPINIPLNTDWFLPSHSEVCFNALKSEHKAALIHLQHLLFSSRLCNNGKVFSSSYYWKRKSDTVQHVVCLKEREAISFANVVVFAYDPSSGSCNVLVEELELIDPFSQLENFLHNDDHEARIPAVNAVHLVQTFNNFFMLCSGQHLVLKNALDIIGPATYVEFRGKRYVSRL